MARLKLTRQTRDEKRQGAPTIIYKNMCIHHYLNLGLTSTYTYLYIYAYTYKAMARLKLTRQTRDEKRQGAPTIIYKNMCIHHYLNLGLTPRYTYLYIYTYTYKAMARLKLTRQTRDEKRQGAPTSI